MKNKSISKDEKSQELILKTKDDIKLQIQTNGTPWAPTIELLFLKLTNLKVHMSSLTNCLNLS